MLMEMKIPSTIMNFSLVVRFLRFFLRAMTSSGLSKEPRRTRDLTIGYSSRATVTGKRVGHDL